jgi:hypothetical protein
MKKTIVAFLLIIGFTIVVSGCNSSIEERIVGTWSLMKVGQEQEQEIGQFTFNKDGTLEIKTGKSKIINEYKMDGSLITITDTTSDKKKERTAKVKIKKDEMFLTFQDVEEGDAIRKLTFQRKE